MMYLNLTGMLSTSAKNFTKGQFAQNLKNMSDIYEHVQYFNVAIFINLKQVP